MYNCAGTEFARKLWGGNYCLPFEDVTTFISFILLIYLQTANDGRPRLEIMIGNAKANKIGRHIMFKQR